MEKALTYKGLAMHYRGGTAMNFRNATNNFSQMGFGSYENTFAHNFSLDDQHASYMNTNRINIRMKNANRYSSKIDIDDADNRLENRSLSPRSEITEEDVILKSPSCSSLITSNQAFNENKAISRASYMCRKCKAHGQTSAVKQHKKECKFSNCTCKKCQLVDKGRQVVAQQIALYRDQKAGRETKHGKNHSRHAAARAGLKNSFNFLRNSPPPPMITAYSGNELVNFNSCELTSKFGSIAEESDLLNFLGRPPTQKLAITAHPDPINFDDSNIFELQQGPNCRRCRNHAITVTWRGHKKNCPYRLCSCEKCNLIKQRKDTEKDLRNMISMDEENESDSSRDQTSRSFKSEGEKKRSSDELFIKTDGLSRNQPLTLLSPSNESNFRGDKGSYFSNYSQYFGSNGSDSSIDSQTDSRVTLDQCAYRQPPNNSFSSMAASKFPFWNLYGHAPSVTKVPNHIGKINQAHESLEGCSNSNYYHSCNPFYSGESVADIDTPYYRMAAQIVLASSAKNCHHHHYHHYHHYELPSTMPNYSHPYSYPYAFGSSHTRNGSVGPIIEEIDDDNQMSSNQNYSQLAALPAPSENNDFNRSSTNYENSTDIENKVYSVDNTRDNVLLKSSTDGPLWPKNEPKFPKSMENNNLIENIRSSQKNDSPVASISTESSVEQNSLEIDLSEAARNGLSQHFSNIFETRFNEDSNEVHECNFQNIEQQFMPNQISPSNY